MGGRTELPARAYFCGGLFGYQKQESELEGLGRLGRCKEKQISQQALCRDSWRLLYRNAMVINRMGDCRQLRQGLAVAGLRASLDACDSEEST